MDNDKEDTFEDFKVSELDSEEFCGASLALGILKVKLEKRIKELEQLDYDQNNISWMYDEKRARQYQYMIEGIEECISMIDIL